MDTLTGFTYQLIYLYTHLTVANVIDIILVAIVFFVVLQALRQTRSLQLLRGAVTFAIVAAVLLAISTLETFNWLLRAVLLAGAVAWPIIFQEELRQVLTGLGRVGRYRAAFGSAYDQFVTSIVEAVTQLAARREGALIALEGKTPLADIVATGIPVDADSLTAELLVSIFNPNTPLHDGAVILRGDRLVAASCILPVATEKLGDSHLGTRHRAALGLSAHVPDTLVLVVSEETGRISVAHEGRLYQDLSGIQLESWIERFQGELAGSGGSTWQKLLASIVGWFRSTSLRATAINLLIASALALIAWTSVVYQTNPPQQVTIEGIPLTVKAPADGLLPLQSPSTEVAVQVQTTRDRADALNADGVRADLDLSNLPAGVHRVEIDVTLADRSAQILSVQPSFVDVTLEPLISKSLAADVAIADLNSLPPGYTLGEQRLIPDTVTVNGPESLVEQVVRARAELALEGRRTDFQRTVAPQLLDSGGNPVSGLTPSPETVVVTVAISRTFDSREIAVQVTLKPGSLDQAYQVTRVRVTPPVVTLVGKRSALEQVGDLITTAPVDLVDVRSDLTLDVPLIVPEGVTVQDSLGSSVSSVVVRVTVAPAPGYLALTKVPTQRGLAASLVAKLSPASATILLVGSQPLLAQVQDNPGLVTVSVDLTGYGTGVFRVPLQVLAPEGLSVDAFPPEVDARLSEREEEFLPGLDGVR